jgi:hypothetical protein
MKYFGFIFIAAFGFGLAAPASAQMTALGHGGQVTLNVHGVCKIVTNYSGNTIMVPWNDATQWAYFYSYKPASVSVTTCAAYTWHADVRSGPYLGGCGTEPSGSCSTVGYCDLPGRAERKFSCY